MHNNTEYFLANLSLSIVIITIIAITFLSFTNDISTSESIVHAQDSGNAIINTIPVTDDIYMLDGEGGNIGVSVGDDGVFMIDAQLPPSIDEIFNAVREISDKPIKFVVNTHWHPDHVGGNEELGKNGSIIVSHDNTRERLSTEQFTPSLNITTDPLAEEALPIITFTDSITFHFNGDKINIRHIPAADTDGDVIVHFTNSNVIHTGDLMQAGYPFLDIAAGGSIDGIIDGIENTILPLVDENSTIILGHGNLTTTGKLVQYLDMLKDLRNQISDMIQQGRTLDEVKSANPTEEYDKEYGQGFTNSEQFTERVYESLKS